MHSEENLDHLFQRIAFLKEFSNKGIILSMIKGFN